MTRSSVRVAERCIRRSDWHSCEARTSSDVPFPPMTSRKGFVNGGFMKRIPICNGTRTIYVNKVGPQSAARAAALCHMLSLECIPVPCRVVSRMQSSVGGHAGMQLQMPCKTTCHESDCTS
jgi:hypothetical protein